jgi:hypothetical protein
VYRNTSAFQFWWLLLQAPLVLLLLLPIDMEELLRVHENSSSASKRFITWLLFSLS